MSKRKEQPPLAPQVTAASIVAEWNKCGRCGCTDNHACLNRRSETCSWIIRPRPGKPGLCSHCLTPDEKQVVYAYEVAHMQMAILQDKWQGREEEER